MIQLISFKNNNQTHKSHASFSTPVVMLPEGERNYCLFNLSKVNFMVSQKESSLPHLKEILQTSQDEKEIVETLYIIDRMIDNGTKGIPAMYPYLARHNDTKSQNIQTFLAGIYRKTQVPDAFGPLVKMLIQNSNKQEPTNANEEIGGAILEYIRNYGLRAEAAGQNHVFARNAVYREQPSNSNNPKPIDYSA